METTVLITAFILIGLGVLVKRFPILIAGYYLLFYYSSVYLSFYFGKSH